MLSLLRLVRILNFGMGIMEFKGEHLAIIYGSPEKDLLKMITPKTYYDFPIQTYFNDAVGEQCYIDGIKHMHPKGAYNNLNDFDLALCYPNRKYQKPDTSDKYEVSLHFQEAWNGSSCLKVKGELKQQQSFLIKLYKLAMTATGTTFATLNAKYFDKKQVQLSLKCTYADKSTQLYPPNKIALNNGWDSIQFQIPPQNQPYKSLYLQITNISNQLIPIDGLIGGFGMFDDGHSEYIKSLNVDFKDPTKYVKNIQLKESITNLYDLYIVFDFGQELEQVLKTVRIFNDKQWIGNCRANYGYFSEIPFNGKELFIKLQLVLNNGHHMKAESVLPIIVYPDQVVKLE